MEKTKSALGWRFEFVGHESTETFSKIVKNNTTFVGIEFPPSYERLSVLPDHLQYGLIFPGELATVQNKTNPLLYNWWTNRLFPHFSIAARNHDTSISGMVDGRPSGYYEEGFLSLKNAIYLAFLDIKDEKNFTLAKVPKIAIKVGLKKLRAFKLL